MYSISIRRTVRSVSRLRTTVLLKATKKTSLKAKVTDVLFKRYNKFHSTSIKHELRMKPQYNKCIVAPVFAPRWEIRSTEHEQEPMVWGFHLIWLQHSPPQHFALPFTPFLRATHESGRTHSQPAFSTSGPSPSLLNSSCPWAQPQLNIDVNKGENKMHYPIIRIAVIIIEYMFHQQSKTFLEVLSPLIKTLFWNVFEI